MIEFHRWNLGFHDLKTAVGIHPENFPAATGQVAHYFAHAVVGNFQLHVVNRFQKTGLGAGERFLECLLARDLNRDVLGVDGVHLAIVKINFQIDDPVASEDSFLASGHYSFLH